MSEKSYVGMCDCFFCGEPKELLLDRRLRNSLPKHAVYDKYPCDKCAEWMKQGVMFISIRDGEEQSENPYRTGKLSVIRDEAIRRMPIDEALKAHILKARVCFIEDAIWERFGFGSRIVCNERM